MAQIREEVSFTKGRIIVRGKLVSCGCSKRADYTLYYKPNTYPVLITTSRLLSTGVDAQTCDLIALDREVGSMTELKQIVGRGTRVHETPASTTSP